MTEKEWWNKYLTPMIGGEVIETGVRTERIGRACDTHWPYFKVKAKNGEVFKVEVSRDGEGNGPGFLFGLPNVT